MGEATETTHRSPSFSLSRRITLTRIHLVLGLRKCHPWMASPSRRRGRSKASRQRFVVSYSRSPRVNIHPFRQDCQTELARSYSHLMEAGKAASSLHVIHDEGWTRADAFSHVLESARTSQ